MPTTVPMSVCSHVLSIMLFQSHSLSRQYGMMSIFSCWNSTCMTSVMCMYVTSVPHPMLIIFKGRVHTN